MRNWNATSEVLIRWRGEKRIRPARQKEEEETRRRAREKCEEDTRGGRGKGAGEGSGTKGTGEEVERGAGGKEMGDEGTDERAVCLSSFRSIWLRLCGNIVRCKLSTDLCWVCQLNQTIIMRTAANTSEADKSDRCTARAPCSCQ